MFIPIHALVMTTLVRVARSTSERRKSQSSVLLMAVMIPTVLVLMVAHGIEAPSSVRRPMTPTSSILPS